MDGVAITSVLVSGVVGALGIASQAVDRRWRTDRHVMQRRIDTYHRLLASFRQALDNAEADDPAVRAAYNDVGPELWADLEMWGSRAVYKTVVKAERTWSTWRESGCPQGNFADPENALWSAVTEVAQAIAREVRPRRLL